VAQRTTLPPEKSTWLRERLIQYFDEEELRTLCSDLGVDYDSLQGKGKEAKARELVAYLGRHGRIHALIEMCIRLRPHVDCEETTHAPPPERSRLFMPLDIARDFVDRTGELARFQRMLAGETPRRILCILERGEQGKSYFLLRLFHECGQQCTPVPVVLLDFDQRKSDLTDCFSVARQVRRHLDDERTPAICACEEAIFHGVPRVFPPDTGDSGVDFGKSDDFTGATIRNVAGHNLYQIGSISTGSLTPEQVAQQREELGRALRDDLARLGSAGDGSVDFGKRDDFTGATIRDVAGRDLYQNVPIFAGPPTPEQVARQKEELGCAMRDDLARLGRAVVLVDTFEQASEETRSWLERWLFEPLRRELRHVILVVAGRPECQSFFAQPCLWSHLVEVIDRFTPISDDDILAHFRQRGLTVSEVEASLLQIARISPAKMAGIGDLLEQARGGGAR
jgi:hypothetical protein